MAGRPAVPKKLLHEIRILKNRVRWLERALKPAKQQAVDAGVDLDRSRQRAEDDARHKAKMEYYRKRSIEHYRRNPNFLRLELESEQRLNDFLKARGFEPEQSRIPKEAIAALNATAAKKT